MACLICEDLRVKIDLADREHNYQKARVLRLILDGHRKNTCSEKLRGTTIVVWKNGVTWSLGSS